MFEEEAVWIMGFAKGLEDERQKGFEGWGRSQLWEEGRWSEYRYGGAVLWNSRDWGLSKIRYFIHTGICIAYILSIYISSHLRRAYSLHQSPSPRSLKFTSVPAPKKLTVYISPCPQKAYSLHQSMSQRYLQSTSVPASKEPTIYISPCPPKELTIYIILFPQGAYILLQFLASRSLQSKLVHAPNELTI